MKEGNEVAKYSPQPYTQKLIDLGVIKFYENNEDYEDNNEYFIVYSVCDDYFLTFDDEGLDFPCRISDFVEVYMDDEFDCFIVYPYEDVETGNVNDPEEEITVYRKVEVK